MTEQNSRTQIWLVVLGTLLVWGVIGWMLFNLRSATAVPQWAASTRLLAVLCAGGSLLLLLTVLLAFLRLFRLAADSEREHRFPPQSASQYGIRLRLEGEAAWLMAARLRGWGALTLTAGLLIAAFGLTVSVRSAGIFAAPALRFAPVPALGPPSALPPIPDRSTGAPG